MLLFDPDNKEEYKLCKDVYRKMGLRALSMGGTCTGEHGIGTGNLDFQIKVKLSMLISCVDGQEVKKQSTEFENL